VITCAANAGCATDAVLGGNYTALRNQCVNTYSTLGCPCGTPATTTVMMTQNPCGNRAISSCTQALTSCILNNFLSTPAVCQCWQANILCLSACPSQQQNATATCLNNLGGQCSCIGQTTSPIAPTPTLATTTSGTVGTVGTTTLSPACVQCNNTFSQCLALAGDNMAQCDCYTPYLPCIASCPNAAVAGNTCLTQLGPLLCPCTGAVTSPVSLTVTPGTQTTMLSLPAASTTQTSQTTSALAYSAGTTYYGAYSYTPPQSAMSAMPPQSAALMCNATESACRVTYNKCNTSVKSVNNAAYCTCYTTLLICVSTCPNSVATVQAECKIKMISGCACSAMTNAPATTSSAPAMESRPAVILTALVVLLAILPMN